MFSSILNTVESFVESWHNSDDTQVSHKLSEGVWVHDLPGTEAGVTYKSLRTKSQINLEQDNETDVVFDRHQELAHQEVVQSLQRQIAEVERREESALSVLDLTRQQLSERDEYLQLLTNQLKSKNMEIEQKQCTLYEYEERLRMCYDTIRKLEAKTQSADVAVKSLESELSDRQDNSMVQMKTREQASRLALESLQKHFLEKEEQLQSIRNELDNFERQKMCGFGDVEDNVALVTSQRSSVGTTELHGEPQIGGQKCILDANVRLREQCQSLSCSLEEFTEKAAEMEKRNKNVRIKLRVKDSELKQLSQQFLDYQKQRICVLSQAIATLRHEGHEEFHEQKVDT